MMQCSIIGVHARKLGQHAGCGTQVFECKQNKVISHHDDIEEFLYSFPSADGRSVSC